MSIIWTEIPLAYLTNSAVTKYTCPANTKAKARVTAHNNHTSSVVVTVHVIPSGGSFGDANMIHEETIAAGESYSFPELECVIMGAAAILQAFAGTTSVISFGGGAIEKI